MYAKLWSNHLHSHKPLLSCNEHCFSWFHFRRQYQKSGASFQLRCLHFLSVWTIHQQILSNLITKYQHIYHVNVHIFKYNRMNVFGQTVYAYKNPGLIPFLHQRWYRGSKEEATRRIVHTLRKPTTQPTKLAKESGLVLGWL